MAAVAPRNWNETDIPAVPAADLAAALSLWLVRERQGLQLVGRAPIATIETVEAAMIDTHEDPARGLSVLLRLRSLVAALSSRRFRNLVKADRSAELAGLVAVAARMRLNPAWGLSPVRLAWAIAAAEAMEVRARDAA